MNNEPVAWMSVGLDGRTVLANYEFETAIPLYTHPVSQYKAITNTKIEPTVVSYTHPVKELTDEEFDNIFANGKRLGVLETEDRFRKAMNLTDEEIDAVWFSYKGDIKDFARAILRKAQEK